MNFDETIAVLRDWIGRNVALNVTHERHGPADGYIADFAGQLARVEEPISGVDAPVFYFRWADGSGFALHRDLFRDATWQTIAGETDLRVDLDGLTLVLSTYD